MKTALLIDFLPVVVERNNFLSHDTDSASLGTGFKINMESRKLSSKKESNQFKTIEVKREIPIEIDEGNLLAVDIVPINLEKSK